MSYSFLDAFSSVQTAESSVVVGTSQRQVIAIGSVLSAIPVNVVSSGNSSISGTIGASIIGLVPIVGSVSGTVGASIIGTVPVVQSGTWSPSALGYAIRNDAVASFLGANLTSLPQSSDSAGRALTKPYAPEESAIRGTASTVGTSVTALLPSPGTGLRNYITDLIAVNSGAATAVVNVRDADASIMARLIVPAGGGSNLPGLATPLRTGGTASQVDIVPLTPSSMITFTALGYKAP